MQHVANYSLGLYMFFIYVTYSMIRFLNLYACIIVTAVLMLFHAVAVGLINEERGESNNLQVNTFSKPLSDKNITNIYIV